MKIKLPRKYKKVYKYMVNDNPKHTYNKIHSKMLNKDSVICKMLDYSYCIDNQDKGYRPYFPEIAKHRLFKTKN